jgi:hypothetical protein
MGLQQQELSEAGAGRGRGFAGALAGAVGATLADNPAVVAGWMTGTPKTWGTLAGRAVGAARRTLGRDLTETERRAVWQALWDGLEALRRAPGR